MPLTATLFLGIDPGVGGGLAAIGCYGQPDPRVVNWVEVTAMPKSEEETWAWLNRWPEFWTRQGKRVRAAIEKVGGYREGSGGNIGSAMFTFGANYGMLRAFLIALGIPFDTVSPRKWQGSLGIPKKRPGETKPQWKKRLMSKAEELFPKTKVTLATADALLLVEYLRRTYLWR